MKLVSKKEKEKEKTNKWNQFIEGFGQKGTLLSRREREIFFLHLFSGICWRIIKKNRKTCLTDRAATLQIYIQIRIAEDVNSRNSKAASLLHTRLTHACPDSKHGWTFHPVFTNTPPEPRRLWSSMFLWLRGSENTSLMLQQQGSKEINLIN